MLKPHGPAFDLDLHQDRVQHIAVSLVKPHPRGSGMSERTFTARIVWRLHALHLVDHCVPRPHLPAPLLCKIIRQSHTVQLHSLCQ